jgi:hypothetical protein
MLSWKADGFMNITKLDKAVPFQVAKILLSSVLLWLSFTQGMLQWNLKIPFPFWDMIGIESYLDGHPSPTVLDLYRDIRDNEHRPIVSFLFYIWDRNVYGDSGALLYAAIYISEAIVACSLFLSLTFLRRELDSSILAIFVSTVIYLFFTSLHFENLTWQKQIHEVSCLVFVTLGIFSAAMVSVRGGVQHKLWFDISTAAVSGVLCLLATYSFGFGLVSWVAIGMHALIARWRIWPNLAFGALAVATIASYAFTYVILAHHSNPASSLSRPLEIFEYGMRVLSPLPYNLFSNLGFGTYSVALTILISTIGIGVGLKEMRELYFLEPPDKQLKMRRIVGYHAAMIFVSALGMALMTGLGRLTVNSGFDSRYSIIGSLFWSALLVLILVNSTAKKSSAYVVCFGVVTALAGFLLGPTYDVQIRSLQQEKFQAGTLATLNLFIWPDLPALYPAPEPIQQVWHHPRLPFQSFAERAPFGWLGKSMLQFPAIPKSSQCHGHIDGIETPENVSKIVKVRGWAFIASLDAPLKWIIIADGRSIARGVGVAGVIRKDVRTFFSAAGKNRNTINQLYSGFEVVADVESGNKLELWGVDTAGRFCKISPS